MNSSDQKVKDAVELLASCITPPPPPTNLKVGDGKSFRFRYPLAISLILFALVGSLLLKNWRSSPQIQVEYLHFVGKVSKNVDFNIQPIPDADVILVRISLPLDGAGSQVPHYPYYSQPRQAGFAFPAFFRKTSFGVLVEPGKTGSNYFHVRIFRVLWDLENPGSALFLGKNSQNWIPISELESWGHPNQFSPLLKTLGATALEPTPGLVIKEKGIGLESPFVFSTVLGNQLVEVSFEGVELLEHQFRFRLTLKGDNFIEPLEGQFFVNGNQTTAIFVPLLQDRDGFIVSVTPLEGTLPPAISGNQAGNNISDSGAIEIYSPGINGVTYPKRIHTVVPQYPKELSEIKPSGKVILKGVVRSDGSVDGLAVLKIPEGGERLAGSVVDAVSKWKFEPATLNGNPVNVYFTFVTDFPGSLSE